MKAAPFLILFLCSQLLTAENISLQDLLDQTGAQFHWEAESRKGLFIKDGSTVLFQVGQQVMLLDGKILVESGTVRYDRGNLFFSDGAAETVRYHFGIHRRDDHPFRVEVILIDPGHGGADTGALATYTVDGLEVPLWEKNINLDVALRLEEMLKIRYPDKTILMTRNNDIYLTLEDRVRIANGFDLDPLEGMLFISVHTNASLNKTGTGFEVWYLPDDYRRTILTEADGITDPDILAVLNALWEEELSQESRLMAEFVLESMDNHVSGLSPNRGIKEENWFVVTNKKMASILIELGFLTNEGEAALLRDTDYLESLSVSIFQGISDYITYFESISLSP